MTMQKTYVLDTNILIQAPYALESFEDNHIVLPLAVLEALDGLQQAEGEAGGNARQVIRFLERLRLRGSLVDILGMVNTSNPLEMRIYKNLPEAVALLRRHPLINNVTIDGNQLVAGFSGGPMDEARLLGQLITEAGALVGSFGRRQGGLESVFMRITGSKEEKVVAQG